MAIGQNIGVACTAFLPALFVSIAPPGTENIPLKIGALTFGICVISAIAAFTTRETYRIRLKDLGDPNAVPMSKEEYERVQEQSNSKSQPNAVPSVPATRS